MFTIGQVAHRAGIRTSTLRYYEDIGLIPPPIRLSKQRRYDESVFQRLAVIKLAQRAGFTIAEIHTLLHGFPEQTTASERWRELSTPKLAEVRALMQRLQATQDVLEKMLQCQCLTLQDCTSRTSETTCEKQQAGTQARANQYQGASPKEGAKQV